MGKTTVTAKIDGEMRSFDFQDVFLPKSAWEDVKSTASAEQLFLFGLGTKIRLAAIRRFADLMLIPILIVIGIGVLLSFVLANSTIGIAIAVIAYLVGSIFFGKPFKMNESLEKIEKALKGSPYKKKLNEVLERKWYVLLTLEQLENLMALPCLIIDMIALLLDKVFPHLAERREGATFAIPMGCGVDDVAAISDYYHKTLWEKTEEAINDFTAWTEDRQQQYIDEHTYSLNDSYDTVLKPTSTANYDSTNDRYEYKDQNGNIWYSSDNKNFYKKD